MSAFKLRLYIVLVCCKCSSFISLLFIVILACLCFQAHFNLDHQASKACLEHFIRDFSCSTCLLLFSYATFTIIILANELYSVYVADGNSFVLTIQGLSATRILLTCQAFNSQAILLDFNLYFYLFFVLAILDY